jgi:hypothetical protein
MKLLRKNLSTASGWLLLVAVGLCCSDRTYSQVKSPEQADPARWTQEDVTTEQQYVTARKELAAAYHAHHFNCPTCIAAGLGSRYGQRCGAGTALWHSYSGTHY